MSIFAPFTFIAPEEVAAPAPPAASYLNDITASLAMYSVVRKLDGSYTGSAFRVKRTPDNSEQDIGFVGDLVDTASLATFCGANDGYVTIWYDQSGNARDLTQTIPTSQPKIYQTGSISTISSSVDIPAISFDNFTDSRDYLLNLSFIGTKVAELHGIINQLDTNIQGNGILISNPDNGYNYGGYVETSGDTSIIKSSGAREATLTIGNDLYSYTNLFFNVDGGTNASFNWTNNSEATGTLVTGDFNASTFSKIWVGVATYDPFSFRTPANISELAFYEDTSTERTNIRSNINGYYNVY